MRFSPPIEPMMQSFSTLAPTTAESTGGGEDARLWRRQLPAGFLSLLLHLAALVLIGLLAPAFASPPSGEPPRAGGIVLVQQASGERTYFSEADAAAASTQASESRELASALPSFGGTQLDAAGLLPRGEEIPLPGGGIERGAELPTPGELLAGGGSGLRGSEHDYGVEIELFGAKGYGSRFLFVFDRSTSMTGEPLARAKRHLLAALPKLGDTHQFQVIFYNQEPAVFNPHFPAPPSMAFGTPRERGLAADFIERIVASGNTNHIAALRLALGVRLDVIFFLTYVVFTDTSTTELYTIRRWNHGTLVNAVEFGSGPSTGERNFLMVLAEENGGSHVYVDVREP